MRIRKKSETKNFSDFRGRPGRLPMGILKKEYDIRDLESPIDHHAQGRDEIPKKVHQLYWPNAKNGSFRGDTAKSVSGRVKTL